jgi:hypothetical protein
MAKRSSITVAKPSSRVSSPTSFVICVADADKDYNRSPGSSLTPKPDVFPHLSSVSSSRTSADRRSSGSPSVRILDMRSIVPSAHIVLPLRQPSLSRSSVDDKNLRSLNMSNSAASYSQPSQLTVDTEPSMIHSSTSVFVDSFPNASISSRPLTVQNTLDPTENEQADSPRLEIPEAQPRMMIQPLNIRRKAAPSTTPEPRTPTTELHQDKSDEEPLSGRISLATSDGEVGIGLSLLQDMATELDDHSSIRSRTSVQNIDRSPKNAISDRYVTASPEAIVSSSPKRPETEGTTTARQDSRTSSLPTSSYHALSSAGEDWEGAGDIYDDYRYSRFSITSKISRFSQSSGPVLVGGADAAPPLPTDSHPGPDSTRTTHNSIGSSDHSVYSPSVHSIALRFSQPPTDVMRNKPSSRPPSVSAGEKSLVSENAVDDDTNRRSAELRSGSPTQAQDADSSESSLSAFPTPPGLEYVSPALMSAFTAQAPPTSASLVPPQTSPQTLEFDPRPRNIFLPHPYAPKVPPNPSGPLYGRNPSKAWSQASHIIHPDSSISVLRQAAALRFNPDGSLRATTLYGKCGSDLLDAIGPVLVTFGLDPPGPAPVNPTLTLNIPPQTSSSSSALHANSAEGIPSPSDSFANTDETKPSGNALPRANFFPKIQTPRPRSRSFSGFDTHITGLMPLPGRRYGPYQL